MTRGVRVRPSRYFFTQWGTFDTFGYCLYEGIRARLFMRIQSRTMALPMRLT